jgi:recombination protein RecT
MTEEQNLPDTIKKDPLAALLRQDSIKKRFEDVLGKKAAGFMSSIISATNANTELKKADPISIVSAAAVAAALDLPINPSLGFAHIVPYSGHAQFQMGWKGFVQLGMRTGQYKTINATIVKEGELVSRNKFTGEMAFDESKKTSDNTCGYVAYFKLMNGFEKWYYMSHEEVKAHGKRYSKSFANTKGKWQTDFDAMALKTVVKMLLSKYGVLSIDMQTAVQADQAIVRGEGEYEYPDADEQNVIEGEVTEKTSAQELTDRFTKKDCPKGGILDPAICKTCPDKLPECPVL